MHITTRQLAKGSTSSLTLGDDAETLVVLGQGGNCTLEVAGRATGVWIPVRGSLRVRSAKAVNSVRARELLVTESGDRVKAVAHGNSLWLAVLAGSCAWAPWLADAAQSGPQLLPDQRAAAPALRRLAVALARSTSDARQQRCLRDLVDAIVLLQAPLREILRRCPGRSPAEKRRVFVRLQRVRHFIRTCCDMELDNGVLAQMAHYSSSHFLRTFASVFGETPHSYLVGQRLQRAARLLRSGNLAIAEVAVACGFENRSAFSRRFRQHFGITASTARRA